VRAALEAAYRRARVELLVVEVLEQVDVEWTQSSSSNIALPRSVSDPRASVSWVSAIAVTDLPG